MIWRNVIIKSYSSIFNPLLYEVSLFSVERMGKVLQRSSRTCGRNRKQTVLWLRKKTFRPSGSFPSPLFLYGQPIAECTCAVCLSHFRIELQPSLQQPSHCKHKHYYFSQWQLVAKTSSKKKLLGQEDFTQPIFGRKNHSIWSFPVSAPHGLHKTLPAWLGGKGWVLETYPFIFVG